MFRNSLTLDELAVVLGARVLDEKKVFLSSGVVVPSPELLVTMNRDHPAKRYKATRAYLLLGGRRLAPVEHILQPLQPLIRLLHELLHGLQALPADQVHPGFHLFNAHLL